MRLVVHALAFLSLLGCARDVLAEASGIFPKAVTRKQSLTLGFGEGTQGFEPVSQCRIAVENGRLVVESTGHDPYIVKAMNLPGEAYEVSLRLRTTVRGGGAIYWTSQKSLTWERINPAFFPHCRWRVAQLHGSNRHTRAPRIANRSGHGTGNL